mmetsp:Transcript_16508/g.37933  ORF Transcript_16508/g.37933 Transcript_16508/m.37933 type:complete len:140 (+) Transcript_16508:680-1099(+)
MTGVLCNTTVMNEFLTDDLFAASRRGLIDLSDNPPTKQHNLALFVFRHDLDPFLRFYLFAFGCTKIPNSNTNEMNPDDFCNIRPKEPTNGRGNRVLRRNPGVRHGRISHLRTPRGRYPPGRLQRDHKRRRQLPIPCPNL